MKQKSITVDIDTEGAVKIEGHNFQDASCAKATAFLEAALGVKGTVTRKPECGRKIEQVKNINQ